MLISQGIGECAAIAALPFEHPKLAVTASMDAEGFAAQLEAARARAAKVIAFRAEPALAHTEDHTERAD